MSEPPFELPGYDVESGWVPSQWMQQKVAKAAFDILAGTGDSTWVSGPKGNLFSVPLGGKITDNGSEEDLTCDKCDKVVMTGLVTFAIGYPVAPGMTVMVTGGLCEACAKEENALPPKEKQ
jgi:hypothetical protein